MRSPSHEHQLHQYDYRGEDMGQLEEVRHDIEQVVDLACMGRQLTESQQALLRWATGTQKPEQPKDFPQMPLGWGEE